MLFSKSFCKYQHIFIFKKNLNFNQNINLFTRKLTIFPRNENKVKDIENLANTIDNKIGDYYLPEPPSIPEFITSLDTTTVYNHLGEATFASLGLNSYWPTGWAQAGFETLHVTCNLPWWASIIISAVVVRAVMFPLSIKSRKALLENQEIVPKVTELQKKVEIAKLSNDIIAIMKYSQELQSIIEKSDFKPLKSMVYGAMQIPPFIAIMIGLRQMANLPVASLQNGGTLWFPDLTMCDPYYVLPIATMLMLMLQIEIGADMNKRVTSTYAKWGFRALPIVGLIFTCNFPSALLLYWCSTSVLSVSIVGLLKIPIIKSSLGITDAKSVSVTAPNLLKKDGVFKEWRKSAQEKEIMRRAKNREVDDTERWIKAGTSAIPKTFSYDPTKVKSTQ